MTYFNDFGFSAPVARNGRRKINSAKQNISGMYRFCTRGCCSYSVACRATVGHLGHGSKGCCAQERCRSLTPCSRAERASSASFSAALIWPRHRSWACRCHPSRTRHQVTSGVEWGEKPQSSCCLRFKRCFTCSLHGGASLKGEKDSFAA